MDYVYGHTSMSQNNKIEVMEGNIIYIYIDCFTIELVENKIAQNVRQDEIDMQKR